MGFVKSMYPNLDKAGTEETECSRKVASGRRVAVVIRTLANARDLQIECATVLHGTLLAPVLMYGSETRFWKEKERSRTRAVQMDNLGDLLGIRRMGRIPNAWIRELCRVKGVDQRINKGVLWWFGPVKRIEKDRTAERVYVRECADNETLLVPSSYVWE